MAGREPSALVRFVRRLAVPDGAGTADAQLLRRYLQGDAAAFAALVQRHGPMVFGVCRRMLGDVPDAEDCFQATFLVLARRARAVGRPELVGGWLHAVACRVAARARAVRARRQARERQVIDVPAPESTPGFVWSELRPVLDEEVARLPERYRLPFVLCYLHGHTNAEAAALLGCPRGTVMSRLATARERLRRRLTRRGITLSAAGLGALVGEYATAAVPAALVQSTIHSIAGAGSTEVAVLAKGVLATMRMHRLARVFGLLVLTALFAGGTGALLRVPLFAQAEAATQEAPPIAQAGSGKKAAPPAQAGGATTAVAPQAVIEAYQVNDAQADELFTGKRVRVVGQMAQVKRVSVATNQPQVYRLVMGTRAGDVHRVKGPGMPPGGKLPRGPREMLGGMPGMPPMGGAAPTDVLDMLLTFDFPLAAAKELAVLRPGQGVTVEARCEGVDPGTESIRFRDAKLIEVHKEGKTEAVPPAK